MTDKQRPTTKTTAQRRTRRAAIRQRIGAAAVIVAAAGIATAAALAIAQTPRQFPDIPTDHPNYPAIRWAVDENLYRGFPDGSLRPDAPLTETQFVKVARRLYDRHDEWTRAQWAQVIYAGLPTLTSAATTAPATTNPVVIEGEDNPQREEPGEATTTIPPSTTTTTTTIPPSTTTTTTTTTTTIPPFPIDERLATLEGKITTAKRRYNLAVREQRIPRTEEAQAAANAALDYATELRNDYANYPAANEYKTERVERTHEQAARWTRIIKKLMDWQTTNQPKNTPERQLEKEWTIQYGGGTIHQHIHDAEFHTRARSVAGVLSGITGDMGTEQKRNLYEFVYYHAIRLITDLDRYKEVLPSADGRAVAAGFQRTVWNSARNPFVWLLKDAGMEQTNAYQWIPTPGRW